jgi:STE24 endopeptidase
VNESKATRYQRLRRRAQGTGVTVGALLLAGLVVTSGSRSLGLWASARALAAPAWAQPMARLALFVLSISCLWELLALPVVLYLGLHVERRFRKSEHTSATLVSAHVQSALVGGAIALGASIVVRASMALAGAWWWAAAGLMIAAGLGAALRAAPLLMPLAGDMRPLERPGLSARVAALSARAGVPLLGLYVWHVGESERASALLAGSGRTRRAVISEAIERDWSDDEIEVVLAHELAHHAHHDLWRTLVLDAVILCAALLVADRIADVWAARVGLAGSRDLAALPLLALVVGAVWLMATPIRHLQSRWQERHADRFALRMTGHADAFSTAVRRLGALHLSEERPSHATRWLYHRHPSVQERLALATAFKGRGRDSVL